MTCTSGNIEDVERLVESSSLSDALESEHFKKFLEHVPIAIAVSELLDPEVIIYANSEFERVSGLGAAELEQRYWDILSAEAVDDPKATSLVSAIVDKDSGTRVFRMHGSGHPATVELHSNVIENDDGVPKFRLVALIDAAPSDPDAENLVARVLEIDTQLRELQHRVKNNLQMITALIRMETRNAHPSVHEGYSRLAGRVASLALLYDRLSVSQDAGDLDLGVYLSQIAAAVMATHAVNGITLDLRVDTYMVSVNVAMPTGLVVNELLTNSLKHAFHGREHGVITLHSEVDGDRCKITVADDGVGLPLGETWPKRGRLGALIATSLKENAGARFDVTSDPSMGTAVTISFERSAVDDGPAEV